MDISDQMIEIARQVSVGNVIAQPYRYGLMKIARKRAVSSYGSHHQVCKKGIAQSLAGRTSILILLPLSMDELAQEGRLDVLSCDQLFIRGFMPKLHRKGSREHTTYYRDYLNIYVEKDLREMLEIKNLDKFLRFLTLLAGRVGQVVIYPPCLWKQELPRRRGANGYPYLKHLCG